jgi:hypothetical protein
VTISRSNALFVVVVVLAITVAAIVVQSGQTAGAARPTTVAVSLAASSLEASSTGSALSESDPAQQVPNLDQFTSRDPFIQATASPGASPTATASPTSSASPSPSPSPTPTVFEATVRLKVSLDGKKIDETFSQCRRGAVLPPGRPLLRIAAVFGDRVKFEPIDGYRLVGSSDSKTFEVWTGKSASPSIRKGSLTTLCWVSVLHIGGDGTGSSSDEQAPLGVASGQSIEALSIVSLNGVPGVILAVDDTVYPAEEIGQTFTTVWGQIEVIGVDEAAHTVTVEHGDLQETLHLGQPVSQ